jgi:hypothetical protein
MLQSLIIAQAQICDKFRNARAKQQKIRHAARAAAKRASAAISRSRSSGLVTKPSMPAARPLVAGLGGLKVRFSREKIAARSRPLTNGPNLTS